MHSMQSVCRQSPACTCAQEGATRAQAAVSKAVDTALDLPLRATPADASVHGPPVQGIVSGGDASSPDKPPQLMRSALPAAVR